MSKQQFKTVYVTLVTSDKLARADHIAERLYIRLLLTSDGYGVRSANPRDVLKQAVPYIPGFDSGVIATHLDVLEGLCLIEQWDENGKPWMYILGYEDLLTKKQRENRAKVPQAVPPSQAWRCGGDTPGYRDATAPVTLESGTAPVPHGNHDGTPGKRSNPAPQANRAGTAPVPRPIEKRREEENKQKNLVVSNKVEDPSPTPAAILEPLPPKRESVAGQIREVHRMVGGMSKLAIDGMIGRRQHDSGNALSPAEMLEQYWRPAAVAVDQFGAQAVRAALGKSSEAVHWKFVQTILNGNAREAAERAEQPSRVASMFDESELAALDAAGRSNDAA